MFWALGNWCIWILFVQYRLRWHYPWTIRINLTEVVFLPQKRVSKNEQKTEISLTSRDFILLQNLVTFLVRKKKKSGWKKKLFLSKKNFFLSRKRCSFQKGARNEQETEMFFTLRFFFFTWDFRYKNIFFRTKKIVFFVSQEFFSTTDFSHFWVTKMFFLSLKSY